MPTKRWIDKKHATTFALVHRPQNDPRIHDEDASDMVFKEVVAPNQKVKSRVDLEEELQLKPSSVRANEGEAALHGIYYDDTSYDYMQHMRDLGAEEGYFVEAPSVTQKPKGKGKQKLEDALRDISIEEGPRPAQPLLLDEDILPSRNLRKSTYQDQQDVPDALAGFQPDMDQRLRETLEALEDEAYVDDDEDVFGELVKDGVEVSLEEFVEEGAWDEEGGWETDDTAKPDKEFKRVTFFSKESAGDVEMTGEDASHGHGDWMAEFSKYKKAEKARKGKQAPSDSDLQSSAITGTSITGGRRKKRKGALTSTTSYSMTSSSIFRTEGLRTLDDRFEKIEEEYAADTDMDEADDVASVASSAMSQNHDPIREDFDAIMEDFLSNYSMAGKKRVKKGGYQTGIEQLDELMYDA
ncbi:hypothetical protein FGG08_005823 [Glutinoglossum americanum]|uniref:Low temperature viability protein n=1 Tax=Glutinoglossum americanum TaxID=1670608 RepID=A0A9P8HTU8_9PEZI|nr:hypothetical protein FGG08_005823 [Glutinoglossum americanum]